MYIIDYQYNKYIIDIHFDSFVDRIMYQDAVNYLKSLYLFFDSKINKWVIEEKRLDEILLWLEKSKIEYAITDKVSQLFDKKEFKKETNFFRNKKLNETILNEGIKLFDYQKQAIQWRLSRDKYLDSFDAGLGKSAINICVFSQLYKEGNIDSILLVVPSGLLYHWKHEILYFTNQFKEEYIQLINNSNKVQPFNKYKDKKILIIANHLLADVILSYKGTEKVKAKNIRWKKFVDIKKEWDKKNIFLLLDEAHAFKHSNAKKTKALMSIKDQFTYRTCLSATPGINRVEDLYTQINFLDDSIIKLSENAFKLHIADEIGDRFNRYAIKRYNSENVNTFLTDILPIFDKKLKSEIPEVRTKKIIKPIYLEINSLQQQIYREIIENEILKLEKEYDLITWKLILNKLQSIIRVIDNPLLLSIDTESERISKLLKKWDIKKDPKLNALTDRVNEYVDEQGEKLIIYCIYPENLNMLSEYLKKYKPLTIHGSLVGIKDKDKDREEKKNLFNNSDENRIMILSALTSSQGISLNKKCRRIIVYSMPWDATLFEQLSNRTDRINSIEDSIIEILCIDKTIDCLRLNRNMNRIDLNNRLGKEISKSELQNLLRGIV